MIVTAAKSIRVEHEVARRADLALKRSHGRFVHIDSADREAVERARSIIRLSYKVDQRTPLRRNVRFRELETVFACCGTELPDDDAGEDTPRL
jgi:hypothetical protein